MRKCRFCHAEIADASRVCEHCGRELFPGHMVAPVVAVPSTSAAPLTGATKRCPFCAEEIQLAAVKCRYCDSDLPELTAADAAAAASLSTRETTIADVGLHWIVFRRPAIWLGFALLASVSGGTITYGASMPFWVIGFVDLIGRATLRTNTKFVLTTRRLSVQTGVLRRRSLELLLSKIESIAVSETYFGQIFGYGTIVVGGTGGTKESFPMVPSPQTFRKSIQDLAHV